MEVIDVLAFYTRLYVYFTYTVRTHLSVFLVYTACICPFLVFMCSNTNRLSFLANQPILCSTYVFETFLCLLLSFFVVDFLCRFNLLNCEYCVKAFLKRLSIHFPQPSDLVVIIPQKLLGLPFPRSDHKLLSLSVANFYGFCWYELWAFTNTCKVLLVVPTHFNTVSDLLGELELL